MITDLIAQLILLFSRLLALLFILKAAEQLVKSSLLGRWLQPFVGWMNPILDLVRKRFLGNRTGFDFSPILAAVFILIIGSFLAWLF